MSFSLVPDYAFTRLTEVTPEFLKGEGIEFLMLDLDNTVSPYGTLEPTDEAYAWFENMKRGGIELFFVSNNKGDRPEIFAGKLGIKFIKRAKKPSRRGIEQAMELMGYERDKSALAGDQVYTDILGANRSGIKSIVVQPIKFSNPFFVLRYILEIPFRMMCRKDFRR